MFFPSLLDVANIDTGRPRILLSPVRLYLLESTTKMLPVNVVRLKKGR